MDRAESQGEALRRVGWRRRVQGRGPRRGLEEGGLEGDGYRAEGQAEALRRVGWRGAVDRAESQGEALRRVGWRETGTGQRTKERP